MLDQLPTELLARVLAHVPPAPAAALRLAIVSRRFRDACDELLAKVRVVLGCCGPPDG